MNDAWARLCESVGATPETVFAGYKIVEQGVNPWNLAQVWFPPNIQVLRKYRQDPPAYLRKPNRTRWRGIIRAALGKRACGWAYRTELSYWPPEQVSDIRKELAWFDRFWELHGEGLNIRDAAKQTNEEFAEEAWVREDAAAALQEPTKPWAQVKRELGLDKATPATGGQSAASCGAKEGRSTEVPHGEQQ